MAGLQHHKVAMDPAFVRLNNMQINRYKYFRWTPRTGFLTTLYVFVIPGIVGYIGWKWDVSFPLFHLLSYEPNIISSIRAPGTSEQSAGEISSPSAKRGRSAEGKCTYLDEKGASKTDTKQAVRGGYTTEPFLGCKIRMMCFALVTVDMLSLPEADKSRIYKSLPLPQ
ncbi:uncharacterized protein PODANS_7_5900 [Podospora anserina S mat+]|uniref:Podospora anserina S mat+ genomic DNA chromosome 7, supercontig 1 n=1 Tax=Podospora anserina (strain S / ATCC MYA-4624 / DSM 980 / FGSC 10383) TaxID=515849 RepID=B2AW44_PODAN|nr:uncharacterized protein PODANS_7_5900 [Podospora anserina S mat+]CAP68618.1 unnamed protein product [Podospora anserina S mat+]CDP32091.1 Putative protein of unknown function [Podospora anserina S mat+]